MRLQGATRSDEGRVFFWPKVCGRVLVPKTITVSDRVMCHVSLKKSKRCPAYNIWGERRESGPQIDNRGTVSNTC